MTRTMFHTQLDELRDQIVDLGRRIESTLEQAVAACVAADTGRAEEVLATHKGIGKASRLIRETSVKLLATQQPLASDLRLIFASMNIATDLERIGSHARSIARLTLQQDVGVTPLAVPDDLIVIATCARTLLHEVIDAFHAADVAAAQRIEHAELSIDVGYQAGVQALLQAMTADPHTLTDGMRLLKVAHKIERIGDHIRNIAERAIFVRTGALPGVDLEE